jgi:surface protein
MENMFSNCRNLKNIDLFSFDVKHTLFWEYIFDYCENLEEIKVNEISFEKILNNNPNLEKIIKSF